MVWKTKVSIYKIKTDSKCTLEQRKKNVQYTGGRR